MINLKFSKKKSLKIRKSKFQNPQLSFVNIGKKLTEICRRRNVLEIVLSGKGASAPNEPKSP